MKEVVIATTTQYVDIKETRTKLAIKTVREAKRLGYKIVIVDNSPDRRIEEIFEASGAKVFRQHGTRMGEGRRQAIDDAAFFDEENGIVVWMEPEKYTFVSQIKGLISRMRNADMVIPERKSLASYPIDQQRFEWLGNYRFQELTGKKLDVWFGPRIMKFNIVPYFLSYKGDYGDKWDSIFIPVIRAIADERKVIGLKTNYKHPESQTREEQGNLNIFNKRREQLNSLVEALDKEAKILKLI